MTAVHKGERWLVVDEFVTGALVHYRAPFTGGFDCALPVGTEIVVLHDPLRTAVGVSCEPTNYEELESVLVPIERRNAQKYDGYSLVIRRERFGSFLQPLKRSMSSE